MANRLNMICVNKGKLLGALKKRGVKAVDVSRELGFCDTYLSNCVKRGRMPVTTARLLEQIYNIKREEFEVVEETPTLYPNKTPEPSNAIDYDKLYQTIYAAVYHAVKKAWSE